jgi:hypothetical protein
MKEKDAPDVIADLEPDTANAAHIHGCRDHAPRNESNVFPGPRELLSRDRLGLVLQLDVK